MVRLVAKESEVNDDDEVRCSECAPVLLVLRSHKDTMSITARLLAHSNQEGNCSIDT